MWRQRMLLTLALAGVAHAAMLPRATLGPRPVAVLRGGARVTRSAGTCATSSPELREPRAPPPPPALAAASVTRTLALIAVTGAVAFLSLPVLLAGAVQPFSLGSLERAPASDALLGVLLGAISIVFGTLVSMTANVLRQRQLNVRDVLYREVACIDALSHILAKTFMHDPARLLESERALRSYLDHLRMQLGVPDARDERVLAAFDGQRGCLLRVQAALAAVSDRELTTAAFNFSPNVAKDSHFRAWDLVVSTAQLRASRSANLEHTFPFAHWALMALLGACLPLALLLLLSLSGETGLELGRTLAVRTTFAVLCGLLAAVFNFLAEMGLPLSGLFQISVRRLDVVQAGIDRYISAASAGDVVSLEEHVAAYTPLWVDPAAAADGDDLTSAGRNVGGVGSCSGSLRAPPAQGGMGSSINDDRGITSGRGPRSPPPSPMP